MALSLAGKVALVTGASRGIGAAIARALAKNGATVVLSSRKAESVELVAAQIRSDGGRADSTACHIGNLADIERTFEEIDSRHGRLDILINNAATNPWFGPILETDPSAFQKTVDVNLRGYFFMSSGAARRMASGSGGVIVNVASIFGVAPGAGQGIYSITKAAVIAMTKSFALECASSGVRVNAILPGGTRTQFAEKLITAEETQSRLLNRIPVGRFAEPNEMTGAVLYLVSDAASYTTGACIPVDGGYLAA